MLADRYERPLSRATSSRPRRSPTRSAAAPGSELTDTHVAQPALGRRRARLRCACSTALGVEPAADRRSQLRRVRRARRRGRARRRAAAARALRGPRALHEARPPPARPARWRPSRRAPEQLAPLLEGGGVVAANLNSPRQTVLSGPREHVEAAVELVRASATSARGCCRSRARSIRPHVAGAQQQLAEVLARRDDRRPARAGLLEHDGRGPRDRSGGDRRGARRAPDQARSSSCSEIEAMYEDGARVFVEVGPRSVLSGLVRQILERARAPGGAGRTLRAARAWCRCSHCLAALAAEGVPFDAERAVPRPRRPRGPIERGRRARPPRAGRGAGCSTAAAPGPPAEPRPLPRADPRNPLSRSQRPVTTSMNAGLARRRRPTPRRAQLASAHPSPRARRRGAARAAPAARPPAPPLARRPRRRRDGRATSR